MKFSFIILLILPTLAFAQPKLADFKGCLVWKKIGEKSLQTHNKPLCETGAVPFSTFKLPNSLIGLETGAITPETVIKWDGKAQPLKEWEQDHKLASAIKVSCVPFYQEVARRVGAKRMQQWLDRFNYGNREQGTVVDRFWLDGPLKITPVEQMSFMERLYTDQLPVKKENAAYLRSIIIREEQDGRILSGKTGSTREDGKATQGWFVGHLKTKQGEYVFTIYEKGADGISGPAVFEKAKVFLMELKL